MEEEISFEIDIQEDPKKNEQGEFVQTDDNTEETVQTETPSPKKHKKNIRQFFRGCVLFLQGINGLIDLGKTVMAVLAGLGFVGFAIWKTEHVGLSLSPEKISLPVNSEYRVVAEVKSNKEQDYQIIWSSNDTAIATVTQDGLVRGKSEGNTDIKADIKVKKNKHITKSCSCTVYKSKPDNGKKGGEIAQPTEDTVNNIHFFDGKTTNDGKPHANHGVMYFYGKERIPGTGCMAEYGDRVTGQWRDGKIVKGEWYRRTLDSTVRIYAGQMQDNNK